MHRPLKMLSRMFPACLVALVSLVSTTTASKSCTAPEQISTQADINALLPCTDITTSVTLGENLTGTFSLPNLVSLYAFYASNSVLTNISLPNLVSVTTGITISLPNLTTLDTSSLQSSVEHIELNTPSLVSWNGTSTLQSASTIYIQAHNISALRFESLTNVSESQIQFTSQNSSLYLNGTTPSMNVIVSGNDDTSFQSSLPTHGFMALSGLSSIAISAINCSALIVQNCPNLTTLILPNLTSIGPKNFNLVPTVAGEEVSDRSDVLLMAYNALLSLAYFPVLETVLGSVQLMGNPLLERVTGMYEEGVTAGAVVLPKLSGVTRDILVSGNVDSFQLPYLLAKEHSIGGHINVTTTSAALNCSLLYPFYDLYIITQLILTCVTPSGDYSLPPLYTSPTPTATATSTVKTISKAQMIGAGFGIAVAALIVSTALAFWIIRARGI